MGEPLKIKRIEDMSRLSWLEHVITEASLMTRSIRLHSILMNWMCFPLQVWGGFAPRISTVQNTQTSPEFLTLPQVISTSIPIPIPKKNGFMKIEGVIY